VIFPGPIYEHEDAGFSKLSEYALGREKRLVVRRVRNLATSYRLYDLRSGDNVSLSPQDVERLRETLSVLLARPGELPEDA